MSKPKNTFHSALLGGVAALLLSGSALAGPPLICHPFVTAADAKLLPWVPTTKNWSSPDHAYRRSITPTERYCVWTTHTLGPEEPRRGGAEGSGPGSSRSGRPGSTTARSRR